jgi:hypothetical protein
MGLLRIDGARVKAENRSNQLPEHMEKGLEKN